MIGNTLMLSANIFKSIILFAKNNNKNSIKAFKSDKSSRYCAKNHIICYVRITPNKKERYELKTRIVLNKKDL